MQRLLLRAPSLAKHRHHLPAQVFAAQVRDIEDTCDYLLTATAPGRHARRLQKRYRKYREGLFTFLHRADVPSDNNACERTLRKSVTQREVTGGFRMSMSVVLSPVVQEVVLIAQARDKLAQPGEVIRVRVRRTIQ